jgi:predicted nucleic acid-binding protein
VAIVYFDASAFVKLVVDEDGSDLAAQLWNGCDAALSSRLAYPEVCAALAAAGRNRQLSPSDLRSARRVWEGFWAATRVVELTETVALRAGELAGARALRGADAVHLASALAVGDPDLVVAVWDRQLSAGAKAENLRITPRELETW